MLKKKKTHKHLSDTNDISDTNISDKKGHDKVAEILGLPQGTFKNFPTIQIRGNREIVIDGCTGLLSYADDDILIETRYCRIKITGRNLSLKNLSKTILSVRGFIKNVEFNM